MLFHDSGLKMYCVVSMIIYIYKKKKHATCTRIGFDGKNFTA